MLVGSGYGVEQNPLTQPNGTNPDYIISGPSGQEVVGQNVVADAISPTTSNAFNIVVNIDGKITRGQAEAVAVNFADSDVDVDSLIAEIESNPVGGPVVIIDRDGRVIVVAGD